MIDLSELFRVRDNRLEVFVTGLSVEFTKLSRKTQFSGINDSPENRLTWIYNAIADYIHAKNLSSYNIILDCRMENFFINYIAKNIIERLGVDASKVKVLTSIDPAGLIMNYEIDLLAYTNYCYFYEKLAQQNIDWENIEIDIPIMSLSGRATENRVRFAKDLIELCGDKARISVGNTEHYVLTDQMKGKFEDILAPYPFPLKQNTDDKILGDIINLQENTGFNLYKSLIAIVHETNDFTIDHVHLTEKSFKFFAWHQIPIFYASPSQVEMVRGLGFDLFDDIIDHSYDTSLNSHLHRLKFLNSLAKFMKEYPTVDSINRLRNKIFHRLSANNKLLAEYNKTKAHEPWPYYG